MHEDIPVKKILAAIWLGIGSLLSLAILFVLRHLLFDLTVAVFLAVVLNVPVMWLVQHRIKRGFAVAITMIGVFLLVIGIAAAIATALTGIVTGTALAATRVPFVLPLAMWAGLVDILPIVGGLLAIFVVSLFAFTKSLFAGIVVVVVMFVYQQVKNHLLYPVVVGRAVRLNSLVVLLAVLAGAQVGGVAGAIFAIPVAAVIHVGLTEFLGPRIPWLAE